MVSIKSLRRHKIFGLAVFDLVTALIGTVLVFLGAKQWHFPDLNATPFVWAGVLLAIPIGIAAHILFGVNTQLNYDLGLSHKPK